MYSMPVQSDLGARASVNTAEPRYDRIRKNMSIIPLQTGLHLMEVLAKTVNMNLTELL
jgi:hypothetical protein